MSRSTWTCGRRSVRRWKLRGAVRPLPKIVGGPTGWALRTLLPPWSRPSSTIWLRPRPRTALLSASTDDVTEPACPSTFPSVEGKDVFRGLFFGLGSDGTVGANKNTLKIVGAETDNFAQGYFVYDSKKSGSLDYLPYPFRAARIDNPYLMSSHLYRLSQPLLRRKL